MKMADVAMRGFRVQITSEIGPPERERERDVRDVREMAESTTQRSEPL